MPSYSGFWDTIGDAKPYAPLINSGPVDRQVALGLRRFASIRLREVIDTVTTGSSINGAAAVTYKRVKGDGAAGQGTSVIGGGLRDIETVTVIGSSATTNAADVARVDGLVDYSPAPASYAPDLSGNGGGGRLDFIPPLG